MTSVSRQYKASSYPTVYGYGWRCRLLTKQEHYFVVYLTMIRFTCSLIYYSLSLNTAVLHGNIYVNTFICGAVEVPAYIIAMLLMDSKWFGRRWTGCLSLLIAGIVSFLCIPMIIFREYSSMLLCIDYKFSCKKYLCRQNRTSYDDTLHLPWNLLRRHVRFLSGL
jgi:hypothetical protein